MKRKWWVRVLMMVPFICLIILKLLSFVPVELIVVTTGDGSYSFEIHNWVIDYYFNEITQLMLLGSSTILCSLGIAGGNGIKKEKEECQKQNSNQVEGHGPKGDSGA